MNLNTNEENYEKMRKIIINYCNDNCNKKKLQAIKTLYVDLINSKRSFERIENITDLIKVLEKRDCLSHTDIKILFEIADIINIRHMLNYFNNKHELNETQNNLNCNQSRSLNSIECMYFVLFYYLK